LVLMPDPANKGFPVENALFSYLDAETRLVLHSNIFFFVSERKCSPKKFFVVTFSFKLALSHVIHAIDVDLQTNNKQVNVIQPRLNTNDQTHVSE
jgi:hypothetical protein